MAVLLAAAVFAAAPLLVPELGIPDPGHFLVRENPPPVQPAPYATAIWWVIQAWLLVSAGFGLSQRADDEDWRRMRPLLALSLGCGVAWLFAAPVAPLVSVALIWVMLGTGLRALFLVGDTDRWLQLTPVAVYTGWLTAAAAVSLGLVLGEEAGLPGTLAALIALALGLLIALAVQYQLHRAPEYGLAVIWALVAIVVANWQPLNVAVSGLAVLGILAILSLRSTDTE